MAGGYGYRQILELIQNGADAILEAHEKGSGSEGRIEVLLTDSHLYVANTGAAVTQEGVDALLTSHNSPKRGNQIGRFGLGFKSLLRLGGCIDVISKTWGGVRFDPQRCRNELMERFGGEDAPALRLAWGLGGMDYSSDPLLARLGWAETVVRVSIEDSQMLAPLREEIRAFPAEFLLFNPMPIQLTLDVGDAHPRMLSVLGAGVTRELVEGGKRSVWRLFQEEVRITDEEAKSDATHLHTRERVPLAWAVPLSGRKSGAGRFWAFFPTKTPTGISGILNAPWKLNNDRQGLIPGAWNEMLMLEGAKLVSSSIATLSDFDDPARHLDSFPRRVDSGEVAAPLLEEIWRHLEREAIIPDCNGDLRRGRDLLSHPTIEEEILGKWIDLADESVRSKFVHFSCLGRERRSRLNALSERLSEDYGDEYPCSQLASWCAWISSIAAADEKTARRVLLMIRDVHLQCRVEDWNELRPELRVIPDRAGKLRCSSELMIGPAEEFPPSVYAVCAPLLDDPEVFAVLRDVMEVRELADDVWIERLGEVLERASTWFGRDDQWRDFWSLLLDAPRKVALNFAEQYRKQIKVVDCEGEWVRPEKVLLPGGLISMGDDENACVLVNLEHHGNAQDLLRAAGVTEYPEGETLIKPDWGDLVMDSLRDWLSNARNRYQSEHQNSARTDYLYPRGFWMPFGWNLLEHIQGLPAAKLTKECLHWIRSRRFEEEVRFGHCTRDCYETIDVEHPLLWWLWQFGEFQLGDETALIRVVAQESSKNWCAEVPEIVEVKTELEKLERFGSPDVVSEEERQDFWVAAIGALVTPENLQDDWTASVWSGAATAGVYPEGFATHLGCVPLGDVYVTTSRELAARARTDEKLVFLISPEAVELWSSNGAQRLSDKLKPAWEEASPSVPLIEAFPEVQAVLSARMAKGGVAVRVAGLVMQFNESAMSIPCLLQDQALFFDGDTLDQMSLRERLKAVLTELGNAGALTCSVNEALVHLVDTQLACRRSHVAAGGSLEAGLLRAVGGKPGPLRRVLGTLGQQAFIESCEHEDLARIVLGHLGPSVLSTLTETLEAEGLGPPGRWGTAEAREFVRQLGFPEEFGAARTTRREPEEWSQGPFPLPPLHDFQEEVRDGVKAMIDRENTERKAVISLPTGGGKTRVTVEMAVEFILKPESVRRGVLWIAQTDELCEQAVEAFRQVWPNRGAERTGLRIIRMWGGNPNPSIPSVGDPFVVVASIQTLDARGGIRNGDWTSRFGMLVIDECHHAVTPSYTRLLRFLGFDARNGDEQQDHELVTLGLSATPFRMDDDESKRLAKRFANRWLPQNQESLHRRLLQEGVLCEVTNEELQSGTGLSSSEERELGQLDDLDGFGAGQLLEKINQRLGDHRDRNLKLVERIEACEEQSILLFANSVSHACEMAARLNLAGIPAAAVSGSTSRNARRYFLKQFQRGELRVLCNHSVLTTGFDAPKTDMLLIARQVFSPVRYMQMVGRGLRGVKNGGTEICRIVTVLDNLGRFQNKHPYHYCREYFANYDR